MNYLVFWPDEAAMEKAGFDYICEVPVIFDENWRYQREASWYLRDRAKGEAFDVQAELRAFPARSSIGQYAYKLADFLTWCDWVKRDWREVEYHRDLVSRYQQHMLQGDWAAELGHKLSPSTVNGRVDEAVWFCGWAARRGLRGPFKAQMRSTRRKVGGIHSDSYKLATVQTRLGKVRPKPIYLSIPTPASVDQWLLRFAVERGETKALMAELVIRTALRREEVAQWRIDYLPLNRGNWKVMGDYVSVLIEHGAKGNKSRYIDVPIDLAERLAHYRDVVRPKSRMLYVRKPQGVTEQRRRLAEKEPRLFLSDHTGTPITGKKFYEAWHEVSRPPVTGWSTHLGRHYWTCKTLLDRHHERVKMLVDGATFAPDWATALARDDILMFVKPQLGHVDSRTSEAYTVWLGKMLRSANETGEWIESLEIEEPELKEDP